MALDFPNSPTDGQVYTDATSGERWVYEAATNSWTSKGLVDAAGGLKYKGDLDITAAPPATAQAGWQYSVGTGGTANAGFGPGVSGTITKGSLVMYTGSGWIETSHAVPDATPLAKGIDFQRWTRTGTTLTPATAGDVVEISAGTAALPGLTPVGDPDTGLYAPAADTLGLATNGVGRVRISPAGVLALLGSTGTDVVSLDPGTAGRPLVRDSSGRVGVGTRNPQADFVVSNAGATGVEISPAGFVGNPVLASYDRTTSSHVQLAIDSATTIFAISGLERARLDSAGRFVVGRTSAPTNAPNSSVAAEGGFIVKSANGSYWSVQVSDAGALSVVAL